MLAVSVMTIIRMQERGDLTAVRLPGGAVRCLMTEVEGLTRKVKRLKLIRRPVGDGRVSSQAVDQSLAACGRRSSANRC